MPLSSWWKSRSCLSIWSWLSRYSYLCAGKQHQIQSFHISCTLAYRSYTRPYTIKLTWLHFDILNPFWRLWCQVLSWAKCCFAKKLVLLCSYEHFSCGFTKWNLAMCHCKSSYTYWTTQWISILLMARQSLIGYIWGYAGQCYDAKFMKVYASMPSETRCNIL